MNDSPKSGGVWRRGRRVPSPDHAESHSAWPLWPATRFWFCASKKLPRRYGSGERTPAPGTTRLACAVRTRVQATRSGQEIDNADAGGTEGKRRDESLGPERLDGAIPPAEGRRGVLYRIAIHFEHAIHEIHDPVVDEPGTGVDAALVVTVEGEARFADLDDEDRP